MAVLQNNILAGAAGSGGDADYVIPKSLRFNSGDSAHLSKTFASAGNRRTWTLSFWVKKHRNSGNAQQIFGQYRSNSPEAQNRFQLYFLGTNELEIHTYSLTHLKTNRVFRDNSAWYHIVLAVDTTLSTADNRMRLYVNGVEETSFATRNNPTQNLELGVNTDGVVNIGTAPNAQSSFYADINLADVQFIDGQQLAASDFGETRSSDGVWVPKEYTDFGTNQNNGTTWSDLCTGTSFNNSLTPVNAFDGTTATVSAPSNGNSITFTPATAIPVSSSIKIYYDIGSITGTSGSGDITINGTSYVATAHANRSTNIITITGVSSISSIVWSRVADNDYIMVRKIWVDGAALIDGARDNSFHLDFSDNSSNAALGTDSSGNGTTLPGVSFDGSGDNLSLALASGGLGSGDFTLEYFFYQNTLTNYQTHFGSTRGANGLNVGTQAAGNLVFVDQGGSGIRLDTGAGGCSVGRWHHAAFVRSGTTITGYLDGVSFGTYTSNIDYSATTCTIGSIESNTEYTNGIISNFRIVVGTAVYTSNFTPPTAPLSNITNTMLLCCQSSSSATSALGTAGSITANGDAFATSKNDSDWTVNNLIHEDPAPLPSVLFDGSGDYLSFADSSDFDLVSSGTGDFTIEFFIKRTASASMYVLASGTDSTRLHINAGSGRIHLNNPTDSILMESSAAYTAYNNATGWVHIAFVKSSSTGYIFVNGISQPQHGPAFTLSGDLDFNNLTISRDSTGVQGYISNLRIVKGSALYTSNFATPSAPLSNVTNTKLLCCQSSSSTTAATVTPGTITANGDVAASSVPANNTGAIDVLFDVPTNGTQSDTGAGGEVSGNYATFNPLSDGLGCTVSNGNLQLSGSATASARINGTIGVSSGKWYFEVIYTATDNYTLAGVGQDDITNQYPGQDAKSYAFDFHQGKKYNNGSQTTYGSSLSAGDIFMCALDLDNNKIFFGKNGTFFGSGNPATGANPSYTITAGTYHIVGRLNPSGFSSGNAILNLNAGQRAYSYSAPSGFKSWNTTNLPTPLIADGSDHFYALASTGTSGGGTVTDSDANFTPDLVWVKRVNAAERHKVYDILRGTDGTRYNHLETDGNDTEGSGESGITAFVPGGYTSEGGGHINSAGQPFISWMWNAGTSNTSISAGGLNSSVYNQSQNWTNNVSSTSNITSGHEARLFNGILSGSNSDIQSSQGTSGVINFTSAITGSKIEIYTVGNVGQIGINGNNLSVTANQWVDTGVTSLTSVETRHPGAGSIQNPSGLRVDGKILVDSGLSVTNVPSHASTVRANQTAGFSIVKYVGSNTLGSSHGHGLNTPPSLIVVKNLDSTDNWAVYHKDMGANKYLQLDTTAAMGSNTGWWNDTEPTSSVFYTGNASTTGGNNQEHIAYCISPVAGYSAVGSYTGNGSSDGPFIHTGFKVAFLLYKRTDSSQPWYIVDEARDPDNVALALLSPNDTAAEDTGSSGVVDLLSNGFKPRASFQTVNASGGNYIYMAFAENPFQANGGLAR